MKPGRALDILIATKVMGEPEGLFVTSPKPLEVGRDPDEYSTDIEAAWEVVKKLKLFRTYSFMEDSAGNCVIALVEDGEFKPQFKAETFPHGICLAALKLVGHKF